MNRFSDLNPNVKAARIAALVSLTGILIKDVIVAFLIERKKNEKANLRTIKFATC